VAKRKKEKVDINEIKSRRIDSRPFSEISDLKIQRRSKKKKRVNRSRGGDIALFVFLALFGCFSAMPLILTVSNAFKPLDEIFLYPPRFFVKNPTLDNFSDLVNALGSSLVPFSRYFFNTIMVTIVGTFGHIIISSMCAYPLAKYKVPGGAIVSGLVVYSLMFPSSVTSIPNYMVLNWLGLIDTYWSVILPAFAYSMGLFLMKQFMTSVPTSLIEAAKIDGATEFKIYYSIIMPLVKPAWVTLIILLFQSLWSTYGSTTIYREDYKMVSYALSQIATAGAARQGTLAAVSLIMIIVPIGVFVISQSQVMETMAHSGMK
jgi:ABC-type glycerol-3-phosphate transport system permease component